MRLSLSKSRSCAFFATTALIASETVSSANADMRILWAFMRRDERTDCWVLFLVMISGFTLMIFLSFVWQVKELSTLLLPLRTSLLMNEGLIWYLYVIVSAFAASTLVTINPMVTCCFRGSPVRIMRFVSIFFPTSFFGSKTIVSPISFCPNIAGESILTHVFFLTFIFCSTIGY